MGNPVGILIGSKGNLSFGDFMLWSFPVMIVALLATAAITMWYFRKDLRQFDVRLKERLARNLTLVPQVKVPYAKGLILISVTVLFIACHQLLEQLFGLEHNSILLIAPLVPAGVVMIMKRNRARHYLEREVDWWTLIFFMLLFAVAGSLKHTEVTVEFARYFTQYCGDSPTVLIPVILTMSAVGSAFVDNVIFVAAFCPVIEELANTIKSMPLWWALLFGACFGGNITMIGSTANIVALGMLEKRSHANIKFWDWLKIGFISSLIACTIAWGALMLLSPYMPDRTLHQTTEKTPTEVKAH